MSSLMYNRRIEFARSLGTVVVLLLLYFGLRLLMSGSNTNIVERGVVDNSTTIPILVDHPDGSVTTEYVPMFTQEKPFTESEEAVLFWIVYCFFAYCLWGTIHAIK
jgi:hypothetical protein